MFTRTYERNGYKLVVRSYSEKLSQTEKKIQKLGDSYAPGLLLCVAHKDYEEHFYSALKPSPDGKPRQIRIGGLGTNRTKVGTKWTVEWVPSCHYSYAINEAIFSGFDFSLLPDPTPEEIEISCFEPLTDEEGISNL